MIGGCATQPPEIFPKTVETEREFKFSISGKSLFGLEISREALTEGQNRGILG